MPLREDLAQFEIFSGISDSLLEEIADYLHENIEYRDIPSGEVLLSPGQKADHLLLLKSGVIKSVQYTSSGEELFSYFFTQNLSVFHIACITETKTKSHYVVARNASIINVPKACFLEAMDLFPTFKDSVLRYICISSEKLIHYAFTTKIKKPIHRICNHLIDVCDEDSLTYEIPFNLEMLAQYLNMARPTLSKELHALEDRRAIRLEKNKIVIENLELVYAELNND